jgi:hypothetical protein
MTLKALIEVMPPPKRPVETGSAEQWTNVEESLGTALSTDYREYNNTFGTGCIGAFLWPYNPFSSNENLNLLTRGKLILEAMSVIKERFGDTEVPYPLFPEPGGLLPWGSTDNGDSLFWLTTGNPDEWPVVVNESRGPSFEEFEESMTGFLARLINEEISSEIIPSYFLDKEALFVPIEQ